MGDKKTIKAHIIPENAMDNQVVWESSNEEIASVNQNGTITGISTGTAVITARTDTITAQCNVRVSKKSPDNNHNYPGGGKEPSLSDLGVKLEYTKDRDGTIVGVTGIIKLRLNSITQGTGFINVTSCIESNSLFA